MAQNTIVPLGMLIVFIGIIIIFVGAFIAALQQKDAKSSVKYSFFGLFGFIPFGFSNDKRLFYISIAITVILIIMTVFACTRIIKP